MKTVGAGSELTAAQAEVLVAMDPYGPNHVVEIAAASDLRVDVVRKRLEPLDRKHLVVGLADDLWLNRWYLTELGRLYRDRLLAGEIA